MYDILSLNEKLLTELKEIAKQLKIEGYEHLRKQDLIIRSWITRRSLLKLHRTKKPLLKFLNPRKKRRNRGKKGRSVAKKEEPVVKKEEPAVKKEDDSDKPKRKRIIPVKPEGESTPPAKDLFTNDGSANINNNKNTAPEPAKIPSYEPVSANLPSFEGYQPPQPGVAICFAGGNP